VKRYSLGLKNLDSNWQQMCRHCLSSSQENTGNSISEGKFLAAACRKGKPGEAQWGGKAWTSVVFHAWGNDLDSVVNGQTDNFEGDCQNHNNQTTSGTVIKLSKSPSKVRNWGTIWEKQAGKMICGDLW
jgi:hypothetical protein